MRNQMEGIAQIIEIAVEHPWTAVFLLPLIIWVIILKFKVNVPKIRVERTKNLPIYEICSDTKLVLSFNSKLAIKNREVVVNTIDKYIKSVASKNLQLIFDLSHVEKYNEIAREMIRDYTKKFIDNDNINVIIIFPAHSMDELFSELIKYLDSHKSYIVTLKKDTRNTPSIENEKRIFTATNVGERIVFTIKFAIVPTMYSYSNFEKVAMTVAKLVDIIIIDIEDIGVPDSMLIGLTINIVRKIRDENLNKKVIVLTGKNNKDAMHVLDMVGLDEFVEIKEVL